MNTTSIRRLASGVFATLIAVGALCCTASASTSQMIVWDFTGGVDGSNAATGVAFDTANNAYVTEVTGGLYTCGTVDKLIPASQGLWSEQTLWNFSCGADGKNPHGGVTLDGAGNIYGTTVAGGSGGACTGDGCGVVFRISKRGVERAIYNFKGGNDGFGPGNPVVFDSSGNLYGDAPDGGRRGVGVVYQLSFHTTHWVQTVIHTFTGGRDGGVGSLGPLLIDSTGVVYGVAEIGGEHQAGTAFKIVPSSTGWTFTVLYAFKGTPDAAFPYGGLIADAKGDLFGTTYFGGTSGNGAVFELKPLATGRYREHVVYSFAGGSDGANPTTTLIFDKSGNLWGTTSSGGGSCQCGTIFKIDSAGHETVMHAFGSTTTDGQFPYYGLSFGPNGDLFTSTVQGGTFGNGTIYGIMP